MITNHFETKTNLIFTNVLECYGIHSRVNLVHRSNRCDLIAATKCVNGAVEGVCVRRLATTVPSSDRCSTTSKSHEFVFSDKINLCRRWRRRHLNVYASIVSWPTFFALVHLPIILLGIIPRREIYEHQQRTSCPLHRSRHDVLAYDKRVYQTPRPIILPIEVVENRENTRHDTIQPSDE